MYSYKVSHSLIMMDIQELCTGDSRKEMEECFDKMGARPVATTLTKMEYTGMKRERAQSDNTCPRISN